ncbi:MAG: hypothetical protein VKJ24_06325 [Synechococcales bacterium]|nr:hypothetical protein [Synechococcales bacterium]
MTVEQTTQLIQLVFNSVLMVLASGAILGSLLIRQQGLERRLRLAKSDRRFQSRLLRSRHLRRLQQQIRHNERSLLVINVTCLLFIASALSVGLRSLLPWNELILLSLLLFLTGMATFLVGSLLILMAIAQAQTQSITVRPVYRPRPALPAAKSPQRLLPPARDPVKPFALPPRVG